MARSKKLPDPIWTVIQDQGFAQGETTKANSLEVFKIVSEVQKETVDDAGGVTFADRSEAAGFARCTVGQDVQGKFVKIVIKTRRYFVFSPLRGSQKIRGRKPARRGRLTPVKIK